VNSVSWLAYGHRDSVWKGLQETFNVYFWNSRNMMITFNSEILWQHSKMTRDACNLECVECSLLMKPALCCYSMYIVYSIALLFVTYLQRMRTSQYCWMHLMVTKNVFSVCYYSPRHSDGLCCFCRRFFSVLMMISHELLHLARWNFA